MNSATLPHVMILGGGFGGLSAARALAHAPVRITLVDRVNHHLFQPLLYQVATAALAPSDITAPIRWILHHQKNVTVLLGDVMQVDPDARRVSLDHGTVLDYDYLIVATGARHSYFGHQNWEKFAPGLKSLQDALNMRQRFLLAFEAAERTDDDAERAALLTFVIVGGGPTGCELAGVLPEIAKKSLAPDFRRFDARAVRVILIEAGRRLLSGFPEDLSQRATRDLEKLGVTIRTNAAVTEITGEAVCIGDERIATRNVFWAAGNRASPVNQFLDAPLDQAGRVCVADDLSVPGHPEIFVVGDAAFFPQNSGEPVPNVAPAANQMGAHAAKNLLRCLRSEKTLPFRYFNKGNLAVIGRSKAIADFGRVRLTGFIAWLLWLFVHILYLVGFRNRLSVLLQWAYAYVTYQRGVRLIVGQQPAAAEIGAE